MSKPAKCSILVLVVVLLASACGPGRTAEETPSGTQRPLAPTHTAKPTETPSSADTPVSPTGTATPVSTATAPPSPSPTLAPTAIPAPTDTSVPLLSLEQLPQPFGQTDTPQVGLGDLDGDGDLDAVFPNMGDTASQVWINDGTGRFSDSGQVLTKQGHGVGVGDLDGDGDLDIIMTCAHYDPGSGWRKKPSRVYLNDGRGTFQDSAQHFGDTELSGTGLQLIDLEGDGDLDAYITYYEPEGMADKVYLNDGTGQFSDSGLSLTEDVIAWGDLDGDGDVDLMAKIFGQGYRVRLNDGSGRLEIDWELENSETKRGDITLGDFDRDGDLDALIANGSSSEGGAPTRLLWNDGGVQGGTLGQFTDSGQQLHETSAAKFDVGDLDRDGDLDVFVSNENLPNEIWLNDGSGRFIDSGLRLAASSHWLTTHPSLGDLDGDGDLDVVVAGFGGKVEVWINQTPQPTPTPTPTVQPYEVIRGLSYVGADDPDRSLSVYLPAESDRSLTLLVQGGDYFPGMVRYLADRGYTVVAFDTRHDTFREEIEDGFCALAWAHENADSYGFDAKGIIPVGGSMWGGNAALLGLVDDPTLFLEGCPHALPATDRVRAVITLAGVFDYSQEQDFFAGFIESIQGFMGGTADEVPENWSAASAITWVKGEEPPFLLVHGKSDTNVAPHQSEAFAAALEGAGADVELVLLPGVTHQTSVTDRRVFEAMASYLARLEEADRLNIIGAGSFAFVSDRDGDYEIYLLIIPPPGGGPVVEVQLTNNEADDSVPDWSPDGSRITFASTRDGNWEIYVMDVDEAMRDPSGVGGLRLTDQEGDDLSPVWSPDGTLIAFSSDRGGDSDIYVMRADGTGLRQLTDNAGIESKPTWSPDGTKIAFDSGSGYGRDIYVMDSDGTNMRLLVSAQGGWPAWSPDGTRIAYFDRIDSGPEICVVNVDGTHRTRPTQDNTPAWEPSWSPDGEWLLYVSGQVPDVFMVRADGSETHRLTNSSFEEWAPAWRP